MIGADRDRKTTKVDLKRVQTQENVFKTWTDFPGGFGGVQTPQGRVNTPPENVETPPKKLETPPEISLIFNIPSYSLDYFTTMKLF